MRILILNDSHDRGKNSVNRIGNMHHDLMLKLDETIEISKSCDFVIHLGDIWDSANVSNTIIDDWLDRIEASKKDWHILPGNHDMFGATWETSERSALAHAFKRCKNIIRLDEIKIINEQIDNFYIKDYPYYFNCEEDIKNNGLIHKQKDLFTIACTHAFISIKPFHPKVVHVQAKEVNTNFDLCLCSHFHYDFDATINNTRFLNLNAWGRLSITEAKNAPKVAILDTRTREIEIIKLKSAKPGSEIFDLSKIEEIKKFDKNIEEFIQSLESTTFQKQNIRGIIEDIGKKEKVDKEVINLIVSKMGEYEG